MRGKAQPDGRLAIELIETPVLLISSCDQSTCAPQRHLNMSVAKHTDY